MGLLEVLQGFLNRALLITEFVAKLAKLLLRLENHLIRCIELVNALFRSLVRVGIGLGLLLHLLDFLLAQAGRGLDADFLLFAGGLILGAYVQDAVGVDVKGDLNLRSTAGGGGNAVQVEAPDGLVVFGHGTLALQDVDFYAGLVVARRRKYFRLLRGNGRVGFDQLGHHAAHGFNTQRQRRHVQ